MTDTLIAPTRLERPADAPLAGVCTALARTTGTNPLLWRVLVVVLALFGGLGGVLYLLGVLVIPAQGEPRSVAERLLHGPDRQVHGSQLAVLVLLVVGVAALVRDADGALSIAVLGALGVLWWSRNAATVAPGTPGAPATAGSYDIGAAPGPAVSLAKGVPATGQAPYTPPVPVRTPRRRSPLTGLTVSLAALTAGVLLLVGSAGDTSVPAEVVLAAALTVVGAGLVAGAWWGRSGWLVLLAGILGLALAGTAAVRPALDAGVGSRSWDPTAAASYRLGVGEATLDLSGIPSDPARTVPVEVDARVDVGHLLVLVPDGLRLSLDATTELGTVEVLGDSGDNDGRRQERHEDLGPPGPTQVRLDLTVRSGLVEVRRG